MWTMSKWNHFLYTHLYMSHNCLPSNRPREGLALSLLYFGFLWAVCLLGFLWPSLFVFQCDGSSHRPFI